MCNKIHNLTECNTKILFRGDTYSEIWHLKDMNIITMSFFICSQNIIHITLLRLMLAVLLLAEYLIMKLFFF